VTQLNPLLVPEWQMAETPTRRAASATRTIRSPACRTTPTDSSFCVKPRRDRCQRSRLWETAKMENLYAIRAGRRPGTESLPESLRSALPIHPSRSARMEKNLHAEFRTLNRGRARGLREQGRELGFSSLPARRSIAVHKRHCQKCSFRAVAQR